MYVLAFLVEITFLFYLSKALHKRLSCLFFKLVKREEIVVWLMAVLFLPGTLVHEMSHFLSALFLLVPVNDLEIIPVYRDKKIKLGSVKVGRSDPFRAFFISIAPFVVGNLVIFLTLYFLINTKEFISIFLLLFIFYFLTAVANTMFLSKRDFEGVWKLLLSFGIFYLILYLCGLKMSVSFLNSVLEIIDPVFKIVDLFLLIPIISDIFINITLALITEKNLISTLGYKKH